MFSLIKIFLSIAIIILFFFLCLIVFSKGIKLVKSVGKWLEFNFGLLNKYKNLLVPSRVLTVIFLQDDFHFIDEFL